MTPAQLTTLNTLRVLTIGGVSPTVRELARELGKSDDAVTDSLKHLRSLGLVTWEHGKARTLTVIADAVSPAVLNALSDAALDQVLAHVCGIRASRKGGFPTAEILRKIADGLLAAPKRSAA